MFFQRRIAPGQRLKVTVTDMPPRTSLRALVGVVAQTPPIMTDERGSAQFDMDIAVEARLGPTLLTIGIDDPDNAVTADGILEVVRCPPDLDGSGTLTIFDFLAFQNSWQAGEEAGDYDGDGEPTIFDYLAYQNAFQQGCL